MSVEEYGGLLPPPRLRDNQLLSVHKISYEQLFMSYSGWSRAKEQMIIGDVLDSRGTLTVDLPMRIFMNALIKSKEL